MSELNVARLALALMSQQFARYIRADDRHWVWSAEGPDAFAEAIAHEYKAVPHPDANVVERNHYAWFFPFVWPKELPESFLVATEAKMLEALDDPFVDDAARIMLVLIAELRRLRV